MFATDHPHAYDERPEILLEALDPSARAKVMASNARTHYRL
jgi:hypothetical protein